MRDIAFRAVADHALLIDFADEISDATHARVVALDRGLAAAPPIGFREAVPAYVSLLVEFDPLVTDHGAIEAAVRRLLTRPPMAAEPGRCRDIAVCYDGDCQRDLAEVARLTGLDEEAVIAGHLAGDYRVFMYGFAPGYAYLAGVPDALRLPRKPEPVRDVPAGSVIVAGPQCLVTTVRMPTGWWIIGRSPDRILTGDAARPFLFDVGDRVVFRRIGRAEFAARAGEGR